MCWQPIKLTFVGLSVGELVGLLLAVFDIIFQIKSLDPHVNRRCKRMGSWKQFVVYGGSTYQTLPPEVRVHTIIVTAPPHAIASKISKGISSTSLLTN